MKALERNGLRREKNWQFKKQRGRSRVSSLWKKLFFLVPRHAEIMMLSRTLDLLLVTAKSLQWKDEKAIVEILFDVGMAHDVIFTPLFVSKEEWKGAHLRGSRIYAEILRDGAVIQ